MAVHTETLTNAQSGTGRYIGAGGYAAAVRTSGGGTTKLQMNIADNWVDVQRSGNNVEITSGSIIEGIYIAGVYRWEQTGTAVTETEMRSSEG